MGIDINDRMLVGASYEDLEGFFEAKELEGLDVQDTIEEYFVSMSPYYDAGSQECFYGLKIPNNQQVNEDWWEVVKETAYQFEQLTGVKPRIRGGAHVW